MLFDSTVRRELARSFGGTLFVMLSIVVTMLLIQTLGKAASGLLSPGDITILLGLVVVCAAVCSTWVWPWVYQQRDELKTRFERRSDIARVAPGQFQTSADGRRVFFIEKASSAPE